MSSMEFLAQLFDDHFEVVTGVGPDLAEKVYCLRYLVYCVEHSWLDPAEYPEGQERDEFDARALYTVLIHRRTGDVVGAVRLVLPDRDVGITSLPIFGIASEESWPLLGRLPAQTTAEISRYAVSKTFRKRIGEEAYADINYFGLSAPDMERRLMPHVTLGLLRGIAKLSVEHGFSHLVAVMEPALLRLVSRLGLRFEPVGPLVAWHGTRQPCFAVISEQHHLVREANADFYKVIVSNGTQPGSLPAI